MSCCTHRPYDRDVAVDRSAVMYTLVLNSSLLSFIKIVRDSTSREISVEEVAVLNPKSVNDSFIARFSIAKFLLMIIWRHLSPKEASASFYNNLNEYEAKIDRPIYSFLGFSETDVLTEESLFSKTFTLAY